MPVEPIVTAIVAALTAGVTEAGKKAVGDAYDGLKSLIKGQFGVESEAATALDKLEAKPESEGRKQTLSEELESVDAGSDAELASAAQALIALIRELPQGEKSIQFAQGQGIAQADRGSTATVTFSNGPKGND